MRRSAESLEEREAQWKQRVIAARPMAEEDVTSSPDAPRIDPSKARFPYCIVWSPIPLLTWLFPFIGHMGICSSDGLLHLYISIFSCLKERE